MEGYYSMKRFLKRIILFFAIWLVISSLIDIFITYSIRHSKKNEFVIWEDIINSEINADLLFLGSSRTTHSYNPIVFDTILNTNSYNLGMYAKLIDMDIHCFQLYRETNNCPKIIVWDIFHNSFDYSGQFKDYQYVPYLFKNQIWDFLHNEYHDFHYSDKYIPLYKYWKNRSIIQLLLTKETSNSNYYKGFIIDSSTWWSSDHLNNIEDNSISCNYNQDLVELFESTIEEMQSEGSKIVLVYSPFHIDGQCKIKNLDRFVLFVDSIAAKHNCLFLNYLHDSICNNISFFHNTEHLNGIGADVFSEKLAHDLDSIFNINNNQ